MASDLDRQKCLATWIQNFGENTRKKGRDKLTRGVIEQRLVVLDKYWEEFGNLHWKLIVMPADQVANYVTDNVYEVTGEAYIEASGELRDRLFGLMPETNNASSLGAVASNSHHQFTQLERLEIPDFDGDWLHWPSFKSLFESLVHNDPSIPRRLKLQMLKTHLKGPAADILENVHCSDEGYEGAWTELFNTYENPSLMLFRYMRMVVDCPAASKSSAAELSRILQLMRRAKRAFEALNRFDSSGGDWLLFHTLDKLDASSKLQWQTSRKNRKEIPDLNEMFDFLDLRVQAITVAFSTTVNSSKSSNLNASSAIKSAIVKSHCTTMQPSSRSSRVKSNSCGFCSKNHFIGMCFRFKKLSAEKRIEQVNRLGLCRNCLHSGHFSDKCTSPSKCTVDGCTSKHHTLMHTRSALRSSTDEQDSENSPSNAQVFSALAKTADVSQPTGMKSLLSRPDTRHIILLATALVELEAENGRKLSVRALLDPGSQTSFVSEWVVQSLRVTGRRVNVEVEGLQGSSTGRARSEAALKLKSRMASTFALRFNALVLPKVCKPVPSRSAPVITWPHIADLVLADPKFYVLSRVDVLLGADVFSSILLGGIRRGTAEQPLALETVFGWALLGSTGVSSTINTTASLHCTCRDDPACNLQRFWELEEVEVRKPLSAEDEWCEKHFIDTHLRLPGGRFQVDLPVNPDESIVLGDSSRLAMRIFLSIERKLGQSKETAEKYHQFLDEYERLGHMSLINSEGLPQTGNFLPHHGVYRAHDTSRKIRVVFNASAKTSSGLALNDKLFAGPKLQSDLWVILTRWRFFKVAFKTDIVKMFRQIAVNPSDRYLQQIYWRRTSAEPIGVYSLDTVTYGTSPAPFLALRTLLQLASDEESRFPIGALAIRKHSYVDDIFFGADDVSAAIVARDEITEIFRAGQFPLDKWASNTTDLCPGSAMESVELSESESVDTLGLVWHPNTDTLSLKVTPLPETPNVTKRTVVSDVARLFDPLGWVGPVLIKAKVMVQDLWISGVDWDQPLDKPLLSAWTDFRDSLGELQHLSLPRWVSFFDSRLDTVELHGFSDASKRAFAACVYLKVTLPSGEKLVNLLVAKTKVAPVKSQTIPRLELCGAVLLSRLLTKVKTDLKVTEAVTTAWTDSEVVLAWLRGHSSRWPPFVSHRVAEIQENLPSRLWRHVPTKSNPADLATRGLSPSELVGSGLWWSGPDWLKQDASFWPSATSDNGASVSALLGAVEIKDAASEVLEDTDFESILKRFSTWSKCLRVIAYCLRSKLSPNRSRGSLTAGELQAAKIAVVRGVQRTHFSEEIRRLQSDGNLNSRSRLLPLRPFIDADGVIRVGGRLQASSLSHDEKHPIVVPPESHAAVLIIRHAHEHVFHGGPQLTRSFLQQQFWILRGNNLIRKTIRLCVRCARFGGKVIQQVMGPTPKERVASSLPFQSSGVDYAGPVLLKAKRGRGFVSYKAYICLFVCLSTRAIHLELVTDLTSNAFIAAFQRFTSRRGLCSLLLSDNGTTFRGADKELRQLFNRASQFHAESATSLAQQGVEWKFIPPYAPHFGGLWEAGVKSVKFHIRRIIGEQLLTFEEYSTLLAMIEACLNLRPLISISNDPSDLTALTPGHFLTGRHLLAVPEPSHPQSSCLRSSWRLLSNMRDCFWSRWSSQYLQSLQALPKWRKRRPKLNEGDMVLVVNQLLPPTQWPLGRVVQVHLGPDGNVRVADVRTVKGIVNRALSKLVLLPFSSSLEHNDETEASEEIR